MKPAADFHVFVLCTKVAIWYGRQPDAATMPSEAFVFEISRFSFIQMNYIAIESQRPPIDSRQITFVIQSDFKCRGHRTWQAYSLCRQHVARVFFLVYSSLNAYPYPLYTLAVCVVWFLFLLFCFVHSIHIRIVAKPKFNDYSLNIFLWIIIIVVVAFIDSLSARVRHVTLYTIVALRTRTRAYKICAAHETHPYIDIDW